MKATSPAPASVLIVDEVAETREVLRTILEARGVSILEADATARGLEVLRQHHPNVVILDMDTEKATDEAVQTAYQCEVQEGQAALVVLGRANFLDNPGEGQMIDKPYHYGPLIRTIEQLLGC